MNTQHTPGPWLYAQEGVDAFGIVQPDGHSIVHLVALQNSTSASHLPANARLIAAAPDLLDALKDMLDNHEDACTGYGEGAAEKARDAIAKATGAA